MGYVRNRCIYKYIYVMYTITISENEIILLRRLDSECMGNFGGREGKRKRL